MKVRQNRTGHPEEVVRSMELILELWDELREKPGPFLFTMRGQSMWPSAPEGSVLAIHPCAAGALSPGDLVTYRRGRRVITHRVVGIARDGDVAAWGDSLLEADQPVRPNDVLGRAFVRTRGRVWPTARIALVAVRWMGSLLTRGMSNGSRPRR